MVIGHASTVEFETEPIWSGFPAGALDVHDPLRDAYAIERSDPRSLAGGSAEDQFHVLQRVLVAVGASVDPEHAVCVALAEMMSVTAATTGALWLFQPDGTIARVAQCGLDQPYLSGFEHIAGWDRMQRELSALGDVSNWDLDDAHWLTEGHRQLLAPLGVRHLAVVPLRTRGMRVGLFMLGHSQPGWFHATSPVFLRTMGALIAAAFDNVRLLAELRAGVGPGLSEFGPGVAIDHVFAALDTAVALLTKDGETLLAHNRTLRRLLPPTQPLADLPVPLSQALPASTALAVANAARLAAREGRRVLLPDLEVRWDAGASKWWQVTLAPLPREAGASEGSVVMGVTDDTQRRTLEERYRSAQKLEALGTLSGGIAHEFNNLLTAILGQVSLALIDLPEGHALIPGLRDVESAALRAADLTQKLLGFSRRSPAELRPTNLRVVLDDALPLFRFAVDPRITIEVEADPELWPVLADAAQVGQALLNVCVNARDAMPAGGRMTLRLSNTRVTGEASPRRGEFVSLEVTDSGSGMPPEVRARIFEPFFTTKDPDRGTGLGLSVVHGIVEQHGGWIEVDSQVGVGTSVSLFLPRYLEAAGDGSPRSRGLGETILVADDEPSLRNLSRAILERLGYRVLLASDGEEALDAFRRHRTEVALVILDQTMPRCSGEEALARLREEAPDVPVILTSGYREPKARGPGAAGIADGFLAKPYSPDQVAAAVRAALQSRR